MLQSILLKYKITYAIILSLSHTPACMSLDLQEEIHADAGKTRKLHTERTKAGWWNPTNVQPQAMSCYIKMIMEIAN